MLQISMLCALCGKSPITCFLCFLIAHSCNVEQEMDGKAIQQAYGTCSGPDCMRDVLPKYGKRVKVYHFIKKAIESTLTPLVSW